MIKYLSILNIYKFYKYEFFFNGDWGLGKNLKEIKEEIKKKYLKKMNKV